MSNRISSPSRKKKTINAQRKNKNVPGMPYAVQDRLNQRHGNQLKKSSPVMVRKPFIPPPGKTSPSRPLAWESKSHRLEINPPNKSVSMHVDDLSTSEDDEVHEASRLYQRKIDKLLGDVSQHERVCLTAKTDEQLNASRRLIEDQELEIEEYKKDLNDTARDYSKLRRSLDLMNKEAELSKTEAEILGNEKENLMQKLVEVELEGKAATREAVKLRNSCRKLKQDKKLTIADSNVLARQKELLVDKLNELERSNANLHRLLKESQMREESDQHATDRVEILLRTLTKAEVKIQDQSAQLVDQDKQIDTLISHVEADKAQSKTFEDLQKTMEATRAHLQNQLRQKEGESNRLAIQFKKLEQENNVQLVEVEHYQGLLAATRDKANKDKEALKKATRIQRERAQKQEEKNEELRKQISDLMTELENSKTALIELTDAHVKLTHEKDELQEEVNMFRKKILELGDIVELSSKHLKSGPIRIIDKLLSKTRQLKFAKTENENLKEEIFTLEDNLHCSEKAAATKIKMAEVELSQLNSAVNQYEGLTSEYKIQLERYRSENDELNTKLQHSEKEMQKKLQQSMSEVNEVRSTLQDKMMEFEPYPELLKTSEIRLQDTQDRAASAEKRASKQNRLISELTQKVELQTEQLEHFREKYRSKQDECVALDQQLQNFERKVQDTDRSHHEFILSISRKDEHLKDLQSKLEGQRIESERFIQQLEVALSDATRQADSQKEKALAKERSAQARIMDLEAQVSRSTQNTQLLKRSKEEAERKFNSRLQDMRDRLEQANSTTRSMQDYVQFLKTTYANVFSDEVDSDHKFSDLHY